MKVRCVTESICVEESHRMYVWLPQCFYKWNLDSTWTPFRSSLVIRHLLTKFLLTLGSKTPVSSEVTITIS
jgi:hypothetical protein